jgi:hypothetical protein
MKIGRVFFHKVVGYEGDLQVPKDMLRYDVAFINDAHPGVVAFPVFSVPKLGAFGGKVTHGRWHSFLYVLTHHALTGEQVRDHKLSITSGGWYTYRHPSIMTVYKGPVDYGSLVRVELEAYLKARDTNEL